MKLQSYEINNNEKKSNLISPININRKNEGHKTDNICLINKGNFQIHKNNGKNVKFKILKTIENKKSNKSKFSNSSNKSLTKNYNLTYFDIFDGKINSKHLNVTKIKNDINYNDLNDYELNNL